MVLSGRGAEQQSKGSDTVMSLINLMLALGKVGKPASGYGCLTGQGNGQGGREHGQKADQLPGYRLIEEPEHRAAIAKVWGIDPSELPRKGKSAYELLDSLGPQGGIRGLLVFGSNVSVASPNASNIKQKLAQLELLVVCDAFLNVTAEGAHVVLPIAQWGEEEGTMTNLEGRVILRQRVRPPLPNVKTDIEILCELAGRLGAKSGFSFRTSRGGVPRAAFGDARRQGRLQRYRLREDPQCAGHILALSGARPPGHAASVRRAFRAPVRVARAFTLVPHRPAAELPDAEYPLYFTTGRYKEHYNSGAQTRLVDQLIDAKPEPMVQIHPRLAARLGVAEGSVLGRRRAAAAASRSRRGFPPISARTRCLRRFIGAVAKPPTCSPFRRSTRSVACRSSKSAPCARGLSLQARRGPREHPQEVAVGDR